MTKKCSRCKQEKSTSQFARNKTKPDGLQTMCRPCKNEYGQESYLQNKGYYKENNKRQRIQKRLAVEEYKKGKACVDCGNNNPNVLTLDHRKGLKKVAAVSDMVNRSFSLTAIFKEIAKCDLRCFNCHMIKDHQKR